MNPKQFLLIGGMVLVLVALLGFVGLIGPTEADSIFGSYWWFDNAENWAHLVLGAVALASYALLKPNMQKTLVIAVGVLGLFFAVYNFFSVQFLGANLESPADLILHLAVGIWALWAAMRKSSMASMVS